MIQRSSLLHISRYCRLVLSKYILLAKEMKSQNVTVTIVLVSKYQTHCYWKLLLWVITKCREKSLDWNQD